MSAHMSLERVCYVQCNFCNTILAVNVPISCSNTSIMLNMVTVRCGNCANLLSVNTGGGLLQSVYLQHFQLQKQQSMVEAALEQSASSSTCTTFAQHDEQPKTPPIRAPEKRQRVPSAYNRFIKEEIQRIKACNPKVTHREAFSAAAKNWAHLPNIHFGLNKPS